MGSSYTVTVLPETRLEAFAEQLERMEGMLNLLRRTEGDERGALPWHELFSPAFCRQLWAVLDHHGNEFGDDVDADELRDDMQAEIRTMRLLDAQCDRLRRLLALSEEAREAVGSDVMHTAFAIQDELVRIGRGGALQIPWSGRYRRR